MKVIVTDAQQRTALHVIQALGREGIYVIAIEKNVPFKISICGFLSKYAREKFISPDPERSPTDFIKFLNKLAKEEVIIFPIKITTIELLTRQRTKLSRNIKLPFPDYKTLLQVIDKEILLKKAKMIGVPIHNTFFIRKIEEIKFLSKKLSYPVVIKVRKESNLFQEKRYKIVCSEKEFSEE